MGQQDHGNLIRAILIAKTILDGNLELINSVQFDRQYLGQKEFDINERVKLCFCVKKLIPIIKKAIRESSGSQSPIIQILRINTASNEKGKLHMAGIMVKHNASHYAILINDEENYCVQRLALCKELVEVYVSNSTVETAQKLDAHLQIIEATQKLIQEFYSASASPVLTERFMSSESLAHAIALELLIPYTLRGEIQIEINKGTPILEIANRLFIPVETLEKYLKYYFDACNDIYEILNEDLFKESNNQDNNP